MFLNITTTENSSVFSLLLQNILLSLQCFKQITKFLDVKENMVEDNSHPLGFPISCLNGKDKKKSLSTQEK